MLAISCELLHYILMTDIELERVPRPAKVVPYATAAGSGLMVGAVVTFNVDESLKGPISQDTMADKLEKRAQDFDRSIETLANARVKFDAYGIPIDEASYGTRIANMETGAAVLRARKPDVSGMVAEAEMVAGSLTGLLLGMALLNAIRKRNNSRQRNMPAPATAVRRDGQLEA